MARNDSQQPGSRPRGGPESTEPAYEQSASDRNDLHRQADAQATPETEADRQHRAVAQRTGNAGRAIEAAEGREPSMDLRDDADRAYQQSRGARGERDDRPG